MKFELHVVGIAEDHGGAESGVDDSRVRYTVGVQVRNPLLQLVSIRDSER